MSKVLGISSTKQDHQSTRGLLFRTVDGILSIVQVKKQLMNLSRCQPVCTTFYCLHDLYPPASEPQHQIHDRMCMMNKGTFTCLSYNTNNGPDTLWNQYGGTRITLNKDMRAKKSERRCWWRSDKIRKMDLDQDLRESWSHYCICIGLPFVLQPRRTTYSMESTSTLLQRRRRY